MMSKCGKNKQRGHELQASVSLMARTLLMRIDKLLFEQGVAVRDTCFVLIMTHQPDVAMKKVPRNNDFFTAREKLKVDIPLHLQTINWSA